MATVTVEVLAQRRAPSERLAALVARIPLILLSALFAAYVAFMGVGATLYEAGKLGSGQFDLDAEWRLFAVASGLVLEAAAALTLLAVARRSVGRAAFGLAALLAFMGVDEVVTIHEHLEKWTGIDWEVLYLPLVVAGAIATYLVLRDHRHDFAVVAPFVAGGACWFVAQVLEKLEWPSDQAMAAHYVAMMIPEELLEITGSFLFVVAMVLLVRHRGGTKELAAN